MCLTVRRVGNPWVIRVEQPRITLATIFSKVALIMLLLGLISLLASAIYDSYVLAFIGLGLAFWGALLLLIRPTKYVKLELMTAVSASLLTNIEEMLNATEFNGKGIYLPPEPFSDDQSSLVFVPSTAKQGLPRREETIKTKAFKTSRGFQRDQAEGLYLTPPGYALSKILEKQLGKPFTEIDLQEFQKSLPELLEELEITKHSHVNVEGAIIIIKAKNHIFKNLCEETRKLERTREAVGSPLSSALACALAKATRKPVTIEKEEQSQDGDTTTIRYRLLEE
jgi:hypothetical protein